MELYGAKLEARLVAVSRYSDKVVAMGATQEELELDVLKACYCNAYVTHSGAGGHGKAYDNQRAMERFRDLIKERGGEVPDHDDAFERGSFNGIGAQ
jgi:hypothetical protein